MSAEWQTPKTDWKASDFFLVSDYERIKQNAQYLQQRLISLRGTAPSLSLYSPTESFIPTAAFYNDTENAAADIRTAALTGGTAAKTYTAYSRAWSSEDLNRIEKTQSASKDILSAETAALNMLEFALSETGGYF